MIKGFQSEKKSEVKKVLSILRWTHLVFKRQDPENLSNSQIGLASIYNQPYNR